MNKYSPLTGGANVRMGTDRGIKLYSSIRLPTVIIPAVAGERLGLLHEEHRNKFKLNRDMVGKIMKVGIALNLKWIPFFGQRFKLWAVIGNEKI